MKILDVISNMNILINTNYESVVARTTIDNIGGRYRKLGHNVSLNDWKNYKRYDLIMFLAPDSEVRKAKRENPNAIVGIMDPKLSRKRYIKEAISADFLAVSSLEQQDIFLKYNKNIIIFNWFPDIRSRKKIHVNKDKIIIGYQGNKIHLNTVYPDLKFALEELARNGYNIEFHAIYNIKKLGLWKIGVPKGVKVKHIQWKKETYCDFLYDCDIGVVVNKVPLAEARGKLFSQILSFRNPFGYDKNDYLMRFKYPSNPNRFYEFSQLGIPVVTDMYPSACQTINHGESGFLVNSKEAWYLSLEKLTKDADLRNKFSKNLRHYIDNTMSIGINFKKFKSFIASLKL